MEEPTVPGSDRAVPDPNPPSAGAARARAAGIDAARLAIYLNDHRAASIAAAELTERCRKENADRTDLTRSLAGFADELREERAVVEDLIISIGAKPSSSKAVAARATEWISRFKLNGGLFAYTPLSRLEELEILLIGVRGKRALWASLALIADQRPLGDRTLMLQLIEQADRQEAEIEKLRSDAVIEAFDARTETGTEPPPPVA